MFSDIIKTASFIHLKLEQKNEEYSSLKIYDIYRTISILEAQAKLVISYLSRKIEYIEDRNTSFGSPAKKWIYFNNKAIREYENKKYFLYSQLSSLDNHLDDQAVFSKNFLSKSLNHPINDYTDITHIDETLKLHIYKFNFIIKDCPAFRDSNTIFTKEIINISTAIRKQEVIDEATIDLKELRKSIVKFEIFVKKNYTVDDLLIKQGINN